METKHFVAATIAFVAALLLLGPGQTLTNSGDSVAVDEPADNDRSTSATINAFSLGYFSGLTVGVSDAAIGGLLERGQRERARMDRVEHSDADTLGKLLGFVTLAFFGWRLYKRLNTPT